MKKPALTLVVLFISITAYVQKHKIESLDSFFAGVPLQKNYSEWVLHVTRQYAIDSTSQSRIYSSFKADQKNHFPFPDSIPVRIMLYTSIKAVESARISDTAKYVSLAGLFGSGKSAQQAASLFWNELKNKLRAYYKKEDRNGYWVHFSGGINTGFPDMSIQLSCGHQPKKDPCYVVLRYQHDNWVKY